MKNKHNKRLHNNNNTDSKTLFVIKRKLTDQYGLITKAGQTVVILPCDTYTKKVQDFIMNNNIVEVNDHHSTYSTSIPMYQLSKH